MKVSNKNHLRPLLMGVVLMTPALSFADTGAKVMARLELKDAPGISRAVEMSLDGSLVLISGYRLPQVEQTREDLGQLSPVETQETLAAIEKDAEASLVVKEECKNLPNHVLRSTQEPSKILSVITFTLGRDHKMSRPFCMQTPNGEKVRKALVSRLNQEF